MKKILSTLIAFIVLLSTVSFCAVPSFAQETSKYWEPRSNSQDALGCVNGEPSDSIYMERDEKADASKIEYTGEGELTGWEFPTLTQGKDYTIISQYDNTIIVKFTDGAPYINALVNFGDDKNVNDNNDERDTVSDVDTAGDNEGATSEAVSQQSSEPVSENSDDAVDLSVNTNAESDHTTRTVLIAVGAGVVVCIAAILIVKNKKADA